jgi:hypothetical protein
MRGPKKSETIEIRLPYAAKQAFMARCRGQGVSASQALRAFIDGEVAAPAARAPRLRWAAAGLVALAIGAVAAPSLARPSLQARFARLDSDHDGKLSFAEFAREADVRITLTGDSRALLPPAEREALLRREFARMDLNGDGEIALDEFRRWYGR